MHKHTCTHLLTLLVSGPFPLVSFRLLYAETGAVVLGASLLHCLAQSMLYSVGKVRGAGGRRGA